MKRVERPLVDQAERHRAVAELDVSLCVEAGAGTGKTTLLVDRFLSIIRSGKARCTQVVAITFTEKAAGEMKVRLRMDIDGLVDSGALDPDERERLRAARNDLERAPISTIHSFASSILREYPLEAGVDPGFEQLDALESSLFLTRCWEIFVLDVPSPYDYVLKRFITLGGRIDQLRDMAFLLYDRRGERCVEGIFGGVGRSEGGNFSLGKRNGGGSRGKVGGRTGRGSSKPEEGVSYAGAPDGVSQVLSCDLKSLRELKDAVGGAASDLSSLVENHCINSGDQGCSEIERFLDEIRIMEGLHGDRLEDFLLTVNLPKAKGNKANWNPPEKCAQQKELVKELAALQEEYRSRVADRLRDGLVAWLEGFIVFVGKCKEKESVLDFDDLLIKARELMDVPGALEALRRRYRYILVDEFQDTDPIQAEIVFLLSGGPGGSKRMEPEPGKLFVVGDPKQSIYRFRKADIEIYEGVKERLALSGSYLKITQNFRSVPGIIEWVNSAFSHMIQKPKRGRYQPRYEMIHPRREGTEPAVALVELGFGDQPVKADKVRKTEGEAIALLIRRLVEERRTVRDTVTKKMCRLDYRHIAVIYPGTTGIEYYEEPLRSEEIPYIVEGGKLYYMRQEIRDLASALWAVEDPFDSISLTAALRSPLFGFSDEEIFLFVRAGGRLSYIDRNGASGDERFSDFGEAFELLLDLHRRRNERGPAGTFIELLNRTEFLELSLLRPHGEQRVMNIRKALRDARAFEEKLHSYRYFAKWFRDRDVVGTAEGESPLVGEDENAVRLLTIHRAKGLQFPVVIMANLVQKRCRPSNLLLEGGKRLAFKLGKYLRTSDYDLLTERDGLKQEAEAARLLYVAATRAGDLVVFFRTPKKGSYFDLVSDHLRLGATGEGETLPEHYRKVAVSEVNPPPVMCWMSSELPPLRGRPRPFVKLPGHRAKEEKRAFAAKKEWLASRSLLIGEGSKAPAVITPSGMERLHAPGQVPGTGGGKGFESLMVRAGAVSTQAWFDEVTGPSARGFRVDTGLGAHPASPGIEDRSLRFGLAFHRLMEIADLGGGIAPGMLAASVAALYNLGDRAGELESLARRAISSDLIKSASRASRLYRETPFTVSAYGCLLDGRIDLLFELDGSWTLIDYKTDDVAGKALDERFEIYRPQGGLYAVALRRLGIELRGGIIFYFVRPDEAKVLEVSGELIDHSEDLIRSAARELSGSEG